MESQVRALHSAEGECHDCHESVDHPVVGAILAGQCITCHAEIETQGAGVTAAVQNSRRKEKHSSGDASLDQGMSVSSYYEETRIGAEPNDMIRIPAGEFIMGTDERLPDEGPQHTVMLDAYWIDKYEVTNLQYKQFIDATERKSPSHFENRTYPPGKVDHPVTHVSWYDARDYCAWAGKRLPTDQEWEKAARGDDARPYPWGEEFSLERANTPQRWMALKHDGDTTPVGAFEGGRSPYGLYDMSGNVWEWTSSWYKAYPGNLRMTENYGEKYKTLKGGSWWDCTFYKCGISAPVFNRSFFLRSTRNKSFGFRCAKDDAS